MLAIIGGGPAGLSAAIRARELGANNVHVFERTPRLGGILNQCIHHGFGVHVFGEELTGPEYAARLISRANELKINFHVNSMVVDLSENKTLTYVSSTEIAQVQPDALILATGCRERPRGAIGIPGGRGVGVFTAGTAQMIVNMKGFSIGRRIVILGSGDIGLIMARRMTLEGAEVLGVYEIAPVAGGLKRNIAQCLEDFDIPLYLSHTITRIVGNKRLEGVFVAQVDESYRPVKNTERFIACDALLLSVGLLPENELAKKIGIPLSPITGGAIVNNRFETGVSGVFACGNALHVHDLVDYVTYESFDAAGFALQNMQGTQKPGQTVPIQPADGVRYTVPMAIEWHEGEEYTLLFRSDRVYKPALIKIIADDDVIVTRKKRIILPSEMERVKFALKVPPTKISVVIGEGTP